MKTKLEVKAIHLATRLHGFLVNEYQNIPEEERSCRKSYDTHKQINANINRLKSLERLIFAEIEEVEAFLAEQGVSFYPYDPEDGCWTFEPKPEVQKHVEENGD